MATASPDEPVFPPPVDAPLTVSQLADVVTAKGSFSWGEVFTVTFWVAGALPPTMAENESELVDRVSIGQLFVPPLGHAPPIVLVVEMPRTVVSPKYVLSGPGVYVVVLPELRSVVANAIGTAAGKVFPGKLTVDENGEPPAAFKVQLVTTTSPPAAAVTVIWAVHLTAPRAVSFNSSVAL
jgi:hypothetical protein